MINQENEELKTLNGHFGMVLMDFYRSKTNREIYLSEDTNSPPQLRLIFKTLEFNNSVNILTVLRSNLVDDDIEDLLLALENNKTLYRLELDDN